MSAEVLSIHAPKQARPARSFCFSGLPSTMRRPSSTQDDDVLVWIARKGKRRCVALHLRHPRPMLSSAAMIDIADISAKDIAHLVGEAGFSGVVSLAPLGSGASLDLAFGLAERSHRVPNTVETRFAMASGCKIFTAVVIGSLIQDGKFTPDTRLADCVRSRSFHFGSQV